MIYLSLPYSADDPKIRDKRVACAVRAMARLMLSGHVIVCPVVLNHDAIALLPGGVSALSGAYWRELEEGLAQACDEIVVLRLPGWAESTGVKREMELFSAQAKNVTFMDVDEDSMAFGLNDKIGVGSRTGG